MNYKFVNVVEGSKVYNALLDDHNKLIELHPGAHHLASLVGNIYIGKITNIVKGIRVAFVNIGLSQDIFMQMEVGQHYIYTNSKASDQTPQTGDELLIQITKDAYLEKAPAGTSEITIPGRYSVLTYRKNFVGLSSKIRRIEERNRLKAIFEEAITESYGFIIRTNAEGVREEDLREERDLLVETYQRLQETGRYRKCYSCIYKQPEPFIKLIRDLYGDKINQYVFNDAAFYQEAYDYFDNTYYDGLVGKFKLYEDKNLSLYNLYNLGPQIEKALNERVWLNSGANLIIQPTEALTVIDVNTSKSSSKKDFEETVFQINLEAAKEIARQLRLRNLSGIIVVDFIGMQNEDHIDELMNAMRKLFTADRTRTTLVDMTPLGLVEITRKKTDKNLYEKFKEIGRTENEEGTQNRSQQREEGLSN